MFGLIMHAQRPLAGRSAPASVMPGLFPHLDPALQSEWRGDHALIVSSADPGSRGDPRLARCRETGLTCVIWGQIHNRTELAAALKLGLDEQSGAAVALAAFRQWGRDFCDRLAGEFALAICDPRDNSVTAVRDPMGIRPLYYCDTHGELVLATSIPVLQTLSGADHAIDPQWLARFVGNISMSREDTAFCGVNKVPPGHVLRFDAAGLTLCRYHRFDPQAAKADSRDPAVLKAYRAMLEEAVRCRLDSADPIGIETSGGLDSTTVVGYAPRMVPHPDQMLHGFGFVSSEKEPDAVLGASRFAGLANNHLFVRPGSDDSVDRRALDVLGHPAEHANAVSHGPFYKLGRTLGIRSLLSGFGGDEGVTNYGNNHRRDLIGSGQIKALWHLLKGNPAAKGLRLAKAMHGHRNYPQYAPGLLKSAQLRLANSVLAADVARDISLEERALQGARWHFAYDTLNGFAIGMLEQPFVSTRTESGSLMAASFGIEYHWPLLDHRLIALWLAAPTIEKVDQHMGRYLHRRAVAGVVPDAVRLQVSKNMGSPLATPPAEAGRSDPAEIIARLADGVHPALVDLIDRQRLEVLLRQRATAQPDTSAQNHIALRQLSAIGSLDQWLRLRDGKSSNREDRA